MVLSEQKEKMNVLFGKTYTEFAPLGTREASRTKNSSFPGRNVQQTVINASQRLGINTGSRDVGSLHKSD